MVHSPEEFLELVAMLMTSTNDGLPQTAVTMLVTIKKLMDMTGDPRSEDADRYLEIVKKTSYDRMYELINDRDELKRVFRG